MNIYLRPANEGDLPLMLAWRNSPLVYQGFYRQREPLVWEEHLHWFRVRNRDWRSFIVCIRDKADFVYGVDEKSENDRPVGVVNIGQLDHWSPEIGYHIGEVSLWGRGVGKEAVRLGCEWIKGYGKEYCHTTVLKDNLRSIKLLKSLGFEYMAQARLGEIWMQCKL